MKNPDKIVCIHIGESPKNWVFGKSTTIYSVFKVQYGNKGKFNLPFCRSNHIINRMEESDDIKKSVYEVYNIIADAESKAHKCTVGEVHFHEVGAMDAIADITSSCVLMRELNPDKVTISPINVGSGTVKCAHGLLPVPAPATKNILEGIPYYSSEIQGELCTPTGAALLKYFASTFELLKPLSNTVGRGFGKREFPKLNILTVYLL